MRYDQIANIIIHLLPTRRDNFMSIACSAALPTSHLENVVKLAIGSNMRYVQKLLGLVYYDMSH